ncbi:hypothetical protein FHG87_017712 [Trinorchestia longiramus]|nr:hypothetical protein FHG87_017712 [Trinorchestia longiramus]
MLEAEVAGVRQQLHSQLQEERQAVATLRKQKAFFVQSNEKLQRETERHRNDTCALQKEKAALQKEIEAQQKDLTFLKQELKQKEDALAAKEKEITRSLSALRALQHQLDSEKRQVEELQLCQEPMLDEIQEKDVLIKQLSEAHNTAKLEVSTRARQTKNLARRLAGARKEHAKLTHRLHCRTAACSRLLDGLASAMAVINFPIQLKEVIKDLNERYLSVAEQRDVWTRPALKAGTVALTDDEEVLQASDSEPARELLRQRQRLERAVAKLKSAATRRNAAHRQARSTLVKENSKLLSELASLREASQRQEEEIRQLRSLAPRPHVRRYDKKTWFSPSWGSSSLRSIEAA